ncbi:hypothetical protein SDC9_203107 [bioreactor metagenome]|uniref:Uncharacterized protein n=1 Tax=bioreactor metagenome TaxID=1076179 RepID=A0A645IVH5_9ZZZZ
MLPQQVHAPRGKNFNIFNHLFCHLCLPVNGIYQLSFLFVGQFLYLAFPAHGNRAVRLFFQIDQLHGAMKFGVLGALPAVVLLFTPGRVKRPACVKTAVCTF